MNRDRGEFDRGERLHANLACAGWLGIEGHNHMGVRLAVMGDTLPDVGVTFILKLQVTGLAWDGAGCSGKHRSAAPRQPSPPAMFRVKSLSGVIRSL
ncbi:hypothetical protein [Nonomuraea dietziae]|uniref:Uncharacterized protein n=1 Tax=Nonomuraea dietziae TaxID=65515 RepID=A0A7W5V4L6_9ACTN|nr:hypothetical protein [Nonomuraea dietziae]MBB3726043.1 hypothetical protein [Nonomuraea dietziae]